MPAEWATHEATWITWPRDPETWPGKLDIARQVMARWVREIVRERPGMKRPPEIVNVLAHDEAVAASARNVLDDWGVPEVTARIYVVPNNDVWIRDYGPIFVTRAGDPGDGYGRIAVVEWDFDAWGGKGEKYYGDEAGLDNAVSWHMAELLGFPPFIPAKLLEGGGIEVNGAGTLMAASQCLLSLRERPGGTVEEKRRYLEEKLRDYLGVTRFLWVDNVDFEGDDTDGHIDNLARFVDDKTILTVLAASDDDPLATPLREKPGAPAGRAGRKRIAVRGADSASAEGVSFPFRARRRNRRAPASGELYELLCGEQRRSRADLRGRKRPRRAGGAGRRVSGPRRDRHRRVRLRVGSRGDSLFDPATTSPGKIPMKRKAYSWLALVSAAVLTFGAIGCGGGGDDDDDDAGGGAEEFCGRVIDCELGDELDIGSMDECVSYFDALDDETAACVFGRGELRRVGGLPRRRFRGR
ncbi:MAG: agmatine deiminase family protein [Deltaproteobacteria bacterium]|nr:agmatine deiminase family protein [Deltaproteobacteria bacterium]